MTCREIAWRPDGRAIAFSAGVGLLDYVGLWTCRPSREIVAFLSRRMRSEATWQTELVPRRLELAFVSNVHDHWTWGARCQANASLIVQNRWERRCPLAPDGKRIAFLENHDGNAS